MFRTILLALDSASPIEPLLGLTRRLAAGRETEVVVFHVRRAGEVEPLTVAEEIRNQLASYGLKARAHTSLGDRHNIGASITEAAWAVQADLVVLGSRGFSELHAMVAGSVSHDVMTRTGTPLLLVKCDAGLNSAPVRMDRVLVAIEMLDDLGAIQPMLEQISPRPTELVLYHARKFVPGTAMPIVLVEDEVEAERMLDSAAMQLRQAGYRVGRRPVRALCSDVGRAIALNAEQVAADLILVGSRRPGRVEGLILGSTARAVVQHSRLPVLIAGLPAPVGAAATAR
jgi:nucleotide-binding universal stress UspA family protein